MWIFLKMQRQSNGLFARVLRHGSGTRKFWMHATAAEGSPDAGFPWSGGKVLTVDLHRLGYRVIDVGSLDMEYGWFCEGAAEKCRVIKHEIHTREENEAAGYFDYLDQILTTIH